jgi:hypothetical protein
MPSQIEVVGQVVSGRGIGAQRVLRYQEELRPIVKETLYPGTLNVLLDRPLRLLDAVGNRFDGEGAKLWPASLNGLNVWIYRWAACPLHIVGVLSPLCLRERFNLKDGDNVNLTVKTEQTAPINLLGRLAWAAFWVGRRNSFFSRETCHTGTNKTMIWSRRLGALQSQPEVPGARRLGRLVGKKIIDYVKGATAAWAGRKIKSETMPVRDAAYPDKYGRL